MGFDEKAIRPKVSVRAMFIFFTMGVSCHQGSVIAQFLSVQGGD